MRGGHLPPAGVRWGRGSSDPQGVKCPGTDRGSAEKVQKMTQKWPKKAIFGLFGGWAGRYGGGGGNYQFEKKLRFFKVFFLCFRGEGSGPKTWGDLPRGCFLSVICGIGP